MPSLILMVNLWLEQNPSKASKMAEAGPLDTVAWEFESAGGPYTGRLFIDGQIMTASEATKKFTQDKLARC